jgi:K+-sensing histidine kinase KdpD
MNPNRRACWCALINSSTCESAERAGEIQVRVMDDGPGVPKGSEKLTFEKFHRVHADDAVVPNARARRQAA